MFNYIHESIINSANNIHKDEDDKTDFTKIHDNSFIRAKKRLYRTATEKIYSSVAKADAE